MADFPSFRERMPDEGHEALREPLRAAIDDLADAVSLLAENQAGVQDAYFLNDLLFQMLGESMDEAAVMLARLKAVEARKVNLATATASLGLLSIGTRDVTLTWDNSLGSANYQVDLLPSAGLLGAATFTVKTTYATSAIVTVKTTSLIAAGGSLAAVAWRYS